MLNNDVIPLCAEELCDIISIIGRLDVDGVNYLLFVTDCTAVAEFVENKQRHPIYRIDRVKALPLDSCVLLDGSESRPVESTARRVKQSTGKLLKFVQDKIGNAPKPFAVLDEILRLFNDHPDFYFCFERDITNCTQRGIDSESNVANFVETELLLDIFGHHLSFVQVRGSVPIFWSQKGFKYRPPLSIDRNLEESVPYFTTHMTDLLDRYGAPLVAVNLVDQTGRELKLATSFVEHAIKMDCPDLYLVSFDLHRHCRGLRFDKINTLICKLEEYLTQIGYCWVDKTGEVVKTQRGVVRTNCVDCLDRTNVVQGAISQWVCMRQAQHLGLFGPLCDPPEASGERRLAGIMRDGYNSASRYYLSHVRDSSRQKAINALLGNKDQGSESMADSDSDSEEDENVSRLVSETIHFLLPEGEVVIGGWALCDPYQNSEATDTVVLLTRTKLYVAVYDDDFEKFEEVKIVPLDDVASIEIGRTSKSLHLYLRVTCKEDSWTWRAGRTRLFNNVAIRLRTVDEAAEYTESIAEQVSSNFFRLY
ncbi:unnamed protein product [Nippostrongylus brasiliensis]|uniref:Phosphatidylinositide phosphatase SAC2 (inferred by orthology to a human protein) n=1 Tax=Nippostrongylus brasiliensis TaxID=27835 RepID=A0A0N4XXW7_NIPBR|nr:unnamed protein product [Nippostrongylus brasiliensis]